MFPHTEVKPGRRAMTTVNYDKPVDKLPHCPLHSSDFEFFPVYALTDPDFFCSKNKPRAGISPDRLDEQCH